MITASTIENSPTMRSRCPSPTPQAASAIISLSRCIRPRAMMMAMKKANGSNRARLFTRVSASITSTCLPMSSPATTALNSITSWFPAKISSNTRVMASQTPVISRKM